MLVSLSFRDKSNKLLKLFKGEVVFTISAILAILTSLLSLPKVDYIDFKVLLTLFNLMIVVSAFKHIKILDKISIALLTRFHNSRKISLVLIYLTFFSSMFITNDVALLTFVPLTLIISKRANLNVMKLVIFETLAANIGSGLTPMGNPQNLFIFSFYNLTAPEFFKIMVPFTLLGAIWLFILNCTEKNKKLHFDLEDITIESPLQVLVFLALFVFIVLSVFNIVSYKLAFLVTILIVLTLNKKLFKKVDYILLLTFVCFFIFIGNLSSLTFIEKYIKELLQNKATTYFASITLSQVISNVPCSILLANFTSNWRELLLGVNIGGLGTLIASLASVISYKLYTKENKNEAKSKYLGYFTLYNLISLLIFTLINYLIFMY